MGRLTNKSIHDQPLFLFPYNIHHGPPIILIFVGMRRVGKSCLAKSVSKILNLPTVIDMDNYFVEKQNGLSISQFVKAHSWADFRELELQYFKTCVNDLKKMNEGCHIIVTGAGIVETSSGRDYLKNLFNWNGVRSETSNEPYFFVMHIKRHIMHEILHIHEQSMNVCDDLHRPLLTTSLGQIEDLTSVWQRREPFYDSISHLEYLIPGINNVYPEEMEWFSHYHSLIVDPFILYLKNIFSHFFYTYASNESLQKRRKEFGVNPFGKFCLSLTDPLQIETLTDGPKTQNKGASLLLGADMIEYRADSILHELHFQNNSDFANYSTITECIFSHLSLIRSATPIQCLPNLFTFRSQSQGGRKINGFDSDLQCTRIYKILKLAVKFGCQYIDLEFDPRLDLKELKEFMSLCRFTRTTVVLSYHKCDGPFKSVEAWNDTFLQMSQLVKSIFESLGENSFCPLFIKIIGVSKEESDNAIYYQWIDYWSNHYLNNSFSVTSSIPLICHCMGELGKDTRLFSVTEGLTPIIFIRPSVLTRKNLSSNHFKDKMSGQYTYMEMMSLLKSSHHWPFKRFYLFGNPVSMSYSPNLHNAAYIALGIPAFYESVQVITESGSSEFDFSIDQKDPPQGPGPHSFSIFQAKNQFKSLISIKSLIERDDFGGSSITMPLKMSISSYINEYLFNNDCALKSLNTLFYVNNEENTERSLIGTNTDWIALYELLTEKMMSFHKSHPRLKHLNTNALVLGSGATGRTSLYVLNNLRFDNIYLWNRTQQSAESLIHDWFDKSYTKTGDNNSFNGANVQVLENLDNFGAILNDLQNSDCINNGGMDAAMLVIINTLPLSAFASNNLDNDESQGFQVPWNSWFSEELLRSSLAPTHIIFVDWNYTRVDTTPAMKNYREFRNYLLQNQCYFTSDFIDGIKLLVRQAVYQFYYWFGKAAPLTEMEKAIPDFS